MKFTALAFIAAASGVTANNSTKDGYLKGFDFKGFAPEFKFEMKELGVPLFKPEFGLDEKDVKGKGFAVPYFDTEIDRKNVTAPTINYETPTKDYPFKDLPEPDLPDFEKYWPGLPEKDLPDVNKYDEELYNKTQAYDKPEDELKGMSAESSDEKNKTEEAKGYFDMDFDGYVPKFKFDMKELGIPLFKPEFGVDEKDVKGKGFAVPYFDTEINRKNVTAPTINYETPTKDYPFKNLPEPDLPDFEKYWPGLPEKDLPDVNKYDEELYNKTQSYDKEY